MHRSVPSYKNCEERASIIQVRPDLSLNQFLLCVRRFSACGVSARFPVKETRCSYRILLSQDLVVVGLLWDWEEDINPLDIYYSFCMTFPEISIEEALRRNADRINFASIFGSYSRGHHGLLSDTDIFVVCAGENDRMDISEDLAELGCRIGKSIHLTINSQGDFEQKVESQDYLTASILDDSVFAFGNRDAFFEARERILRRVPSSQSVQFNQKIGLEMLSRANSRLLNLLSTTYASKDSQFPYLRRDAIIHCLRDYHVGVGYLLASAKMRQQSRVITLRHLLASDACSVMKDVIMTEKNLSRGGVDLRELNDLLQRSKNRLATLYAPLISKIL